MNTQNSSNIGDTIRIRRPARITTDELGRTSWMGEVDPHVLELAIETNDDPYNSNPSTGDH